MAYLHKTSLSFQSVVENILPLVYHGKKVSTEEIRIRELGKSLDLEKIHPHKSRHTTATRAIDICKISYQKRKETL